MKNNIIMREEKCKCSKEPKFFHSDCCNTYFEGVIKDGKYCIEYEKCGKFMGELDWNRK